jgi:hypothetical protein
MSLARDIPQHVSANKRSTVYFPEMWRLEVLLNGVRQPYVTEAFAGRDPYGWVMRLDASGIGASTKATRGPTKAVGHVELKWREAADV